MALIDLASVFVVLESLGFNVSLKSDEMSPMSTRVCLSTGQMFQEGSIRECFYLYKLVENLNFRSSQTMIE